MVSFDNRTARLQRIDQGQESYGEGDPKSQAVRFYLDHLLDDVVERITKEGGRAPREPVELLISLSGFSPLTTIITHKVIKPRRLLVVSSETAQDSIDVIAECLVGPGGLRQRDFAHRPCVPTDPLGIYRIVKEELDRLRPADGSRPYAIIDITGGRKVMSAAAALAAWQLGLDLCYIDSEYDPVRHRPIPGSDRLLLLDNPTALFGEQEMAGALQAFASGAFESARQRYDELCESLAAPGRARFMRALSDLYRAWCDLDLDRLPACVETVAAALGHESYQISAETADRLERQIGFLRRLAAGDGDSLVISYFVLGEHYRELGRHDFAALLSYRTIEGCLAGRLESLAPGFTCDRPDYSLLTDDVPGLRERYGHIQRSLGRTGATNTLPPVIGLMSAAVLLTALEDALPARAGIRETSALSHLNTLVTARNKSILAHGDRPVSPKDSQTLGNKARIVLRAAWELRGAAEDVTRLCDDLRFVRTDR
ncbi:TIGR02710 family CRISPR-associated CARF protein [Streptosporangium sp. OZ121]|uniref:TIGR02710 family CRISPR-associated CARF protein n=1 Tax=Streptosporangium sp. OZ121 TaxID=3444183 RepID=UPI003F7A7A0E